MSKQVWGILLLLIGSVALGLAAGWWFAGLRDSTMQIAVQNESGFVQSTARAAFLMYGAGLGVVIWLWCLVAIWLSPLFRSRRKAEPAPAV